MIYYQSCRLTVLTAAVTGDKCPWLTVSIITKEHSSAPTKIYTEKTVEKSWEGKVAEKLPDFSVI